MGSFDSNSITGIFKRKLKPLDNSDAEIKLGEYIDLIWAISNNSYTTKHDSSGTT